MGQVRVTSYELRRKYEERKGQVRLREEQRGGKAKEGEGKGREGKGRRGEGRRTR